IHWDKLAEAGNEVAANACNGSEVEVSAEQTGEPRKVNQNTNSNFFILPSPGVRHPMLPCTFWNCRWLVVYFLLD
ncbi:MAG TPA: hypothetical protein VN670_07540, partial [Acidobacteriaceae bacterium]|nr:hypothetical protein [Acidobacteriaceae bacterium]